MVSPAASLSRLALAFLVSLIWYVSVLPADAQVGHSEGGTKAVPVLVELFTSEGCSDCPPADALLGELDKKQFVPGAQAIVLSEHVTYWNHLGWRDPFSMDEATQRQEEYVRRFGLDSAYTPQMVVDGASQFVGSDRRGLLSAVSSAAALPKTTLKIGDAHWDHGSVRFTVRGEKASGAKLIAALAADTTHSEVKRGENAGRTLHHTAVARVMKVFTFDAADGRVLGMQAGPLAQGNEGTGPVRLVVFLADSKDGHVRGAAEQVLPR